MDETQRLIEQAQHDGDNGLPCNPPDSPREFRQLYLLHYSTAAATRQLLAVIHPTRAEIAGMVDSQADAAALANLIEKDELS